MRPGKKRILSLVVKRDTACARRHLQKVVHPAHRGHLLGGPGPAAAHDSAGLGHLGVGRTARYQRRQLLHGLYAAGRAVDGLHGEADGTPLVDSFQIRRDRPISGVEMMHGQQGGGRPSIGLRTHIVVSAGGVRGGLGPTEEGRDVAKSEFAVDGIARYGMEIPPDVSRGSILTTANQGRKGGSPGLAQIIVEGIRKGRGRSGKDRKCSDGNDERPRTERIHLSRPAHPPTNKCATKSDDSSEERLVILRS
mmetsp:Transcript_24333/g.57050  ORF Transcript_24333/g.57050 Transcript_24333/m.57050 type:complete len:251 (+) Transcript_24333:2409-3161(+)